ncbi:uncharacterized protein [Hoplias malabaricus]|uniref:uncharacterized protein n=1 Tax=Hoplias malabaricus TaxID=27720 RepID=UPI00346274F0
MSEETPSVICRELDCGGTGSESWGTARVESAPNWLDDVKCRKHDPTLGHCPSSPWGQKRYNNRNEVALITCSEDPSQSHPRKKCSSSRLQKGCSVAQTVPPLPVVPFIYPVSLLVLGALLFLALVLLFVLFYQNRVLRRVLSKRRRKTLTEAVYEEIDRRNITKRIPSTQSEQESKWQMLDQQSKWQAEMVKLVKESSLLKKQWKQGTEEEKEGSILSEEQRSGYEDVDEELLLNEIKEIYGDVISADQNSPGGTEDMTENYDDAVPTGPSSNIMTMDAAENYDDVVTAGQDGGGGKDYEDVEEEPQTEMNHVTERPHPVSFLRKLHSNLFRRNK